MADGGKRDTVYLKQGLQSIFRRETVIALADNVFSSQRVWYESKSLVLATTLNVAVQSRGITYDLTHLQLAAFSPCLLTLWDTQTVLQISGKP